MTAVLRSLGRFVARFPRTTVLLWVLAVATSLALALAGITGQALFDRLETGEPTVSGSESQRGDEILAEERDDGEQITVLVQGVDMADQATVQQVATALEPVHPDLAETDGVTEVVSPFVVPGGPADPAAASLVAEDDDGFLLTVTLAPDADDAQEAVLDRLDAVPADLQDAAPDAEVRASSATLIGDAIVEQVQEDLITGEVVALPLALVLMVLVFGGFLAASMPVAGALVSIAVGMGALFGFTYVLDIDSYMVNVVTVVGLGLSVDYGLLVVSRHREELRRALDAEAAGGPRRPRRRGHDPVVGQAVRATLTTAGRTVMFSALTIAVALSGMLLMRPDLMRALSASATAVVIIALLSSITLVPALLALLGRRLAGPSVLSRVPGVRAVFGKLGDQPPEEGVFSAIARAVHARPWPVLLGVLALLGLFASPLTSFDMRSSGVELLPAGSEQRELLDQLEEEYPAAQSPTVVVVADGGPEDVEQLVTTIEDLPPVEAVSPSPAGDRTALAVQTDIDDPGGAQAAELVSEIRGLDSPVQTWVTGQAATQKDFNDALVEGMPLVAAVVVVAVFVLLFLMTGSVLVPLKALLTNAISLAASLGITVWVFIEGHFADLLGFEPVAGLESTVVPLILTFGFGLAMDYEVFLLTRIKEHWDAGYSNDDAVERGLQLMGRIITSAAAIIIAVFAGFAAGDLIVIKQVGMAMALVVAIDATLVRLLLVPATMTLLGSWNWWAPRPLRRLHERLALVH
ncbi:MMPL family transporter [Georgenia sp. 10Sc9-8]|uniref:MMPL family transporter n=1 Tax=Georgenia halotolerans TaxID=3028317 RepID=A0ABT5TZB0_9MICO|nr:MMPL family transporter [Georgenia halotolerans]